jgi:DNA phosphorothioation-associated putative methyltransferase
MNLESHRYYVEAIGYGKKLPGATYLFRPKKEDVCRELWETISRAETAARPDSSWNLLKIHKDQVAITFLTYPEFETDPHPALAESTKINLNAGSVVQTDFRQRVNPPILHRKETFLPPNDPRISCYAGLTKQEEEAGLYREPSRIGLRVQWLALMKRLNLDYEGHTLISRSIQRHKLEPQNGEKLDVARHRTAIKRYDLSKPVKQLLERGLFRKNETFFDYGCGHGMDVEALQNLGYRASGWDPAFRPNASKVPAAVVNLGYVLNVIEDPSERIAALREAYSLAQRLLLVSTMVMGQENSAHTRAFRDGFLTKTNTFQKFYAPGELEGFIEETLDREANTLGLGICVVFRKDHDAELFEADRRRRRIDWTDISTQLRFSTPPLRAGRSVSRYDLNKELFDRFWKTLIELGRSPGPGEFDQLSEVKKAGGGINRALSLVVSHNGEQLWQLARKARTEDVLVYLAMTRFRKRFLRREIPLRIKHDIRSFFGDLITAQNKASDLLFAAGDPGEIELACEGVEIGWQDHDALIIHRSLFDKLPPLLRVYVHCAAHRYGDPSQADLIKIHKHSGKVTFQHYDDFDGKPLPELQTRIKVNLRTLFVEVFDYSIGPTTQLLYFKDRFMPKNHPGQPAAEAFSTKLRKLGFDEATIGYGPDKDTFHRLIAAAGLNENLDSIRKRQRTPATLLDL